MSTPLIYLAAPYSDPDPTVVAARMKQFYDAHAHLLARGLVLVSPLLNHAVIGRPDVGGDWTFWQRYSETLLARCDALWVVMIDGWDRSAGVTGEIEFAERRKMPIRYLDPLPLLEVPA